MGKRAVKEPSEQAIRWRPAHKIPAGCGRIYGSISRVMSEV